jgi:dolichyl-diphosphooligosaccharide--protein glycosyltransferase
MVERHEKLTTAEARQWLLICLVACVLCVGVRLLDLPAWEAPPLNLAEERLFARYDCYGWLAAAEGVNQLEGHPLAATLRLASAVTGMSAAAVGFWLPLVLAPLAALPICLLAVWWGAPRGGVVSDLCIVHASAVSTPISWQWPCPSASAPV